MKVGFELDRSSFRIYTSSRPEPQLHERCGWARVEEEE